MVKKKDVMKTIIFIKFKEPTLKEMSFSGNRKNKIDEKLDKALNTPKRRKK